MNKYSEFSKFKENRKLLYKRIHRKSATNCVKKRSFDNEESAKRFLRTNNYSGRPYICRHCHMWHNTTKDPK